MVEQAAEKVSAQERQTNLHSCLHSVLLPRPGFCHCCYFGAGARNSQHVCTRADGLSRARFIGHQPGVEINWFADRYTTFAVASAGFLVGPFPRDTARGKHDLVRSMDDL